MKPKIVDNLLAKEDFSQIQEELLGPNFPWYYCKGIDYKSDKNFQFCHKFYVNWNWCSQFFNLFDPIVKIIQPITIFRIKANLLTITPDIIENSFHKDVPDRGNSIWTTSIFYVNTNNGYTKFEDGTIVESVANRMVMFPADLYHNGTTCTDEEIRVVVNFNWFLDETELAN
jgi:hypothetical protein